MKQTILVVSFFLLSVTFCFSQQNRGRIQIQGSKLEKSEAWSTKDSYTKKEALKDLAALWKSLSTREQRDREAAYKEAQTYIKRAPKEGYCITGAKLAKEFKDKNRKDSKARIDIEIKLGCAFTDK
ncbi:hypothetical protein [Ascidiimonas sp. W6]|uniref:hypothetical protein n=1 Tax=Ascidiimonas meishanensis TaxID=3128903 RepID=UPI0030ED69B7